jgi:putative flippase GtrA
MPDRSHATMIEWLAARWHGNRQLRFLVVGGWNTLFGYAMFVVLYGLLHDHVHYLVVGFIAHAIAAVNAFIAYRLLVFRSRGPWFAEFLRFNVSLTVVLCCGLAALWLLVAVAHLGPIVAQGLVTIATVCVSYIAHRRFSFAVR